MEKTTHGKQAMQFTRDDIARITASTLNAVLEKLSIRQIVEGIEAHGGITDQNMG